MNYKKFRFYDKNEYLNACKAYSVSPAIGREMIRVRELGDSYPYKKYDT